MTLAVSIKASISAQQSKSIDLMNANAPLLESIAIALSDGTAANQADRIFSDTRTLTASATEDLDLAGVLTDIYSATLTFVRVKAIWIYADPTNTNDVNFTRPAANGVPFFLAAGDGLSVKPGGLFLWQAPGTGVLVTAATGDLITLTNGGAGTSVTYKIIVIGTSA
jgi:hypothetical protein